MKQKYRELTTEIWQAVRFSHKGPRTIRVVRQSKFGRVRYCINGWLFVPAWMRHLDGWGVCGVAILMVLALIAAGTGVCIITYWIMR